MSATWGEMHNNLFFNYFLALRPHCLGTRKNSRPFCGPNETNYGPARHTAGTAILQNPPGGGAGAGLLLSRGVGGGGFWTQNLVYQKWPDQIFPVVNFVFSRNGHFGLGRGEGVLGEGSPPLVSNYSKEALGGGLHTRRPPPLGQDRPSRSCGSLSR